MQLLLELILRRFQNAGRARREELLDEFLERLQGRWVRRDARLSADEEPKRMTSSFW